MYKFRWLSNERVESFLRAGTMEAILYDILTNEYGIVRLIHGITTNKYDFLYIVSVNL